MPKSIFYKGFGLGILSNIKLDEKKVAAQQYRTLSTGSIIVFTELDVLKRKVLYHVSMHFAQSLSSSSHFDHHNCHHHHNMDRVGGIINLWRYI